LASAFLSAATRLRRALHAAGILRTESLPVPVISVGNLSAGGAGKTPLVEHAVRELRALGARPAVLARGYGPRIAPSGLNDEGLVLAENLPGLVQGQDPDRAAAGRLILDAGTADSFVLDDGLQHFRLARDLDVVALDSGNPFGGGLRREGRAGLRRAGAVVLTRASRAGPAAVERAKAEVLRLRPGVEVAVTDHEASGLAPLGGAGRAPEDLRGRAVFAAAGIADPAAFRHTLESLGARVVGSRWFPDHAMVDPGEIARAMEEARRSGADVLVVTQKDAVKLGPGVGGSPLPVAALRIRLRFLEGEAALRGALRAALERGRARAGAAA
jgi:tetraacyldisaccharide 4'-kinase